MTQMKLIVLSLILSATPSFARVGIYTEIPRAKIDPTTTRDLLPGLQIPTKPENYTFKATTKYNGNDLGFTNIRVFRFINSRRATVGEIPAGTEVKITEVRKAGSNIYYSLPFVHSPKGVNPDKQYAWIQGGHLEAARTGAAGK